MLILYNNNLFYYGLKVSFIFYICMYILPALSGLGYIPNYWLALSLGSAWVWSIWLNSAKGKIEYHKLNEQEFRAKDSAVRNSTIIRLISVAAIYGAARILS